MREGETAVGESAGKRGRTRTALAALLATVLLAGGGSWYFLRPPAPPPVPDVDLSGADPDVAARIQRARQTVQAQPRSAAAWGRLGMVLMAHDFSRPATTCFAHAQRLTPTNPQWPYLAAVIEAQTDPAEAVVTLRRAADLCGSAPAAPRLRLAEMLLEQGRLDDSRQQFQLVLDREATNPRAHLGLARVALQRGAFEESRSHLRAAEAGNAARRACALLHAILAPHLGDKSAHGEQPHTAEDLPPDPPWPDPFLQEVEELKGGENARLLRANQLLTHQQTDEALRGFRQVVEDYPNSAKGWLGLARALIQAGDPSAAEEPLQKALHQAPDLVPAHFYLGVARFGQGQMQTAAAAFRRTIELKPDHALAHYNLGHCLKRLDDRAGSIREFQAAVRCKPHFGAAHLNLGEVLDEDGQHRAALEQLQEAVRLTPKDREAQRLLRKVRTQLGQ